MGGGGKCVNQCSHDFALVHFLVSLDCIHTFPFVLMSVESGVFKMDIFCFITVSSLPVQIK